MTLRHFYDERIDQLRSDIVHMGNLADEMTQQAVDAILHGDLELAKQVIAADDEVDALEQKTIREACCLVMQEAPVASTFRLLTSTLGVIGEIEKVADDAVKLARRATKLSGQFPGEFKAALHEMGKSARYALASALRLYTTFSPELAEEIIQADIAIDRDYFATRKKLLELIKANPSATEHLVRTIDAFHALEHVADRAVAIAKRMQVHYGSVEASLS